MTDAKRRKKRSPLIGSLLNKTKMKIYISGKITGLELKEAETKFSNAAAELKKRGHQPINPMEILPYAESLEWTDYMAADIKELLTCDAIVMLPCWKDSKGAKVEHAVAQALELFVQYWPDKQIA